MKILLTICVLLISSSVVAEDISDFEIEGMSIGDSLLDYYSEKIILENISGSQYPSNEFTLIWLRDSKFKTFDAVTITYKTKDNKYTIHAITGSKYYYKNFNDCLKTKEKVEKEVSSMFNNAQMQTIDNDTHSFDETGNSFQFVSMINLKNGDIDIVCYNWSDELNLNDRPDELGITISSLDFIDFIYNRAWN